MSDSAVPEKPAPLFPERRQCSGWSFCYGQDGSYLPLDYATCKDAIHGLVSDDIRPPPRSLDIEACTEDARRVQIVIPYSEDDSAKAFVLEE